MGALVRNERYISQAMAITRGGEIDWRDTSGCEHSERAFIPSVHPSFLILYKLFSCSVTSCLTRCENARTAHSHGMMGCVHEASSLPPFDVTPAVEDELIEVSRSRASTLYNPKPSNICPLPLSYHLRTFQVKII
jgi:hypothetical protein